MKLFLIRRKNTFVGEYYKYNILENEGVIYMSKEIKFDNYLSDNRITFLEKIKYENSEVVYRGNYKISGNNLIFIINIDDSAYTTIQCRLMTLNNSAKREKILYLLNQLNCNTIAKKFILTDDDDIEFIVPFIATEDEFNPEVLMILISNIFKGLEEDYAKLMRVIWS